MVFELFRWWYGPGWMEAARSVTRRTASIEQSFSLGTLVRTLFSPWRRIVSNGGRGLDAKMQAMFDNLVSRFVGFFVRLFVIATACLALGLVFFFGLVLVIIWPLVPLGIVYGLVRSITG